MVRCKPDASGFSLPLAETQCSVPIGECFVVGDQRMLQPPAGCFTIATVTLRPVWRPPKLISWQSLYQDLYCRPESLDEKLLMRQQNGSLQT